MPKTLLISHKLENEMHLLLKFEPYYFKIDREINILILHINF
jgi:hypothetical protein